jgi:hypothetical protein
MHFGKQLNLADSMLEVTLCQANARDTPANQDGAARVTCSMERPLDRRKIGKSQQKVLTFSGN